MLYSRYPYLRVREIIHIELFSIQDFAYIRTVKGCCNDHISILSVNHLGSHIVALCSCVKTNITEIISWNLETEEHKHLAKFSSIAIAGVCFDLRFCLAVCKGESFLRVWNLASKINDQSLNVNVTKMKKTKGIEEIFPMKNYPSYVVCRGLNAETFTVWNIRNSKCEGLPVRVERGLFESTDIVLVKDMKLYILSDKGTVTFTGTHRPIFQTLLVYDLLKKKYLKKISSLYIVPSFKHEYKILEGDLLLGISENRDHFIIWNLKTGIMENRIRPVYKDDMSLSNSLPSHVTSMDNLYKELLCKRKSRDIEGSGVYLTPWEKRNETKTARKRRHEKDVRQEIERLQQFADEKTNSIDQYLLSGNEKIIVCSYFAHHLTVFSLDTKSHTHTLEDRRSMLFLHSAALTHSGSYLVLSNYNEVQKVSYVTLWNLHTGKVTKRLRNEPDVCCSAIMDGADRIVYGVMEANRLKVWDPFRKGHKTISGYEKFNLNMNSRVHLTDNGTKAVILADDVSLWDLEKGTVQSIFTPDSVIRCMSLAFEDNNILLGMSDNPALIVLKLMSKDTVKLSSKENLFGEASSSEDEDNSNFRSG
eukprot:gi/632976972/ref/XP_007905088.1/ PREDICTED: uncharacterized protein LOC103187409 [Callorhinchus milii]